MRDLAAEMGIKAASLYNHIASKQEILWNIIISLAEEFTEELYETLHEKLLQLPHYTMVFPTHHGVDVDAIDGAFYSTIQKSKNLPWLDIPKEEFVPKIIEKTLPRPMNYRKIIAVNKGELELILSDVPDLEIGPNRCAVDAS